MITELEEIDYYVVLCIEELINILIENCEEYDFIKSAKQLANTVFKEKRRS